MTDVAGSKADFRERMMSADNETPALRAEYDKRMNAMLERRLSPLKKIWFIALAVFCVIIGGGALLLAVTEPLPLIARSGLILGVVFAVAWAVFLIRVARRGTMRLRVDPPVAAGMAFCFALLMCVLFAVGGMPPAHVTMFAVLFLIPAGLMVLRTVIEQSESRTQERLVELQYKIARLNERLDGDDEDGLGSGVRA